MRSDRKIRKQIEFLKDDYEWFIRTHHIETDDTNKTGFGGTMALLLHSYREVCENPYDYKMKDISLINITKEAAEIVKQEKEAEQNRIGNKEIGEGVEEE